MGRHRKIGDDELLATARKVFSEHGLVGGAKEIARQAGVSEATLFQRFGTRDKLFFTAMMPPSLAAEALVAQAAEDADDPRDVLRLIVTRSLTFFREVIGTALVLMSHPGFKLQGITQAHGGENPGAQLIRALELWLAQEAAIGRIHCPDPLAAADLIVAAMHSVALFEHMGTHDAKAGAQRAVAAIDSLWPGLEPRRKADAPGAGLARSRKP